LVLVKKATKRPDTSPFGRHQLGNGPEAHSPVAILD
jgi:hypothetical protein